MNEPEPFVEATLIEEKPKAIPDGRSFSMILVLFFVVLQIILYIAVGALGLATSKPGMMVAGFVTTGFYIAIFVGLLRYQEWARLLLLWLTYVGLVSSFLLLTPLEIPVLILAHGKSVREATKRASTSTSYIYKEYKSEGDN